MKRDNEGLGDERERVTDSDSFLEGTTDVRRFREVM